MPEPWSHPEVLTQQSVSAHPSTDQLSTQLPTEPQHPTINTQQQSEEEPRFPGVMPSKRVMGLNWCPQCWAWELSFCLVHWYCWSWTTCLHSPLSQSCPYTTHPSSSRLLSSPFRGCSCAPSTAVLVNQALLPGKCHSHAQPGETGLSWEHPQGRAHSNCTQKLPLGP